MLKKGRRSKYRAEYPAEFVFDYKDPTTLHRFIMDGGKIVPQRISKVSNAQQRKVSAQVKLARNLALLPLGNLAYDSFPHPQPISAKPFEI